MVAWRERKGTSLRASCWLVVETTERGRGGVVCDPITKTEAATPATRSIDLAAVICRLSSRLKRWRRRMVEVFEATLDIDLGRSSNMC